ncbi:MAG: hypothetical protein IPG45_07875 [Deltaproteobacteria bacterium]|nr:hypothetical protein [Deltaproteobacteria bacterium]
MLAAKIASKVPLASGPTTGKAAGAGCGTARTTELVVTTVVEVDAGAKGATTGGGAPRNLARKPAAPSQEAKVWRRAASVTGSTGSIRTGSFSAGAAKVGTFNTGPEVAAGAATTTTSRSCRRTCRTSGRS